MSDVEKAVAGHYAQSRDSLAATILAALANGLGIPTTAEGVENEAQLESIRRQGCTEMQGFLMSEPLPAHEVGRLLAAKAGPPKAGSANAA